MRTSAASIVTPLAFLALAGSTDAGTQDFTLINRTGVDLHNLFLSENDKANWEEDVLGKDILANGESVQVSFSGKSACLWDMMVRDESGDGAAWEGIDLCKLSRVVLHCDDESCWATGE